MSERKTAAERSAEAAEEESRKAAERGEALEQAREASLAEREATTAVQAHPSMPNAKRVGNYFVGEWSGLPNYGCPECSYATVAGVDAIEEHVAGHEPEPVDTGLVGPDGTPIRR